MEAWGFKPPPPCTGSFPSKFGNYLQMVEKVELHYTDAARKASEIILAPSFHDAWKAICAYVDDDQKCFRKFVLKKNHSRLRWWLGASHPPITTIWPGDSQILWSQWPVTITINRVAFALHIVYSFFFLVHHRIRSWCITSVFLQREYNDLP